MAEKNDCFLLGYISKTSGIKGEVIAQFDVDNPLNYKNMESVFIEIDNQLVPFFIRNVHIRPQNSQALIEFEDVETTEKASNIVSCELYLPVEVLPPLKGKNFYFHEVVDYKVIDTNFGEVGIVKSVVSMTAQPIFQIMHGKQEVLIPAVDEIIQTIDRKGKTITVTAPNGLIELYLS